MVKNNMNQKKEANDLAGVSLRKRGQVTVFIIVAILLVAVVLFAYIYVFPNWESIRPQKPSFERCVEKEILPQIEKLSLSAGIVRPTFTSMYLDENYTFVCYTDEDYQPCVVQYPFLKNSFEQALADSMKPIIQNCYDESLEELTSQGYEVTAGRIKTNLEINPDGVRIEVEAPTYVSRGDTATSSNSIDIDVPSQIYTILMIANSILQFESSYGDSDVAGFMFYYPDLTVQKIRRDDSIKLYIITDKKDIKYRFATRSYTYPAGYGGVLS
jgi:hypothetical protein